VTAEALVWHHGYKGLDAALTAAEMPTGDLREDVRAELVAQLAAGRYLEFKRADVFQRAQLLQRWSQRRGQMIHGAHSRGRKLQAGRRPFRLSKGRLAQKAMI
jgi:hypothetical protein